MHTKPDSKNSTIDSVILRQKAEELLKNKLLNTDFQLTKVEIQKLVHELGVHQIELELQNGELMLANERAQVAFEKYSELFDFAPSGYFALSKEGEIMEVNLCGANMLGKERSQLKNSLFGFFVSDDTKQIYNLFLGKIFTGKAKESCEVALSTNGNSPKYVHLTGMVTKNGKQCFITVIDITERKKAEEARQKSEEQFHSLYLNMIDGATLSELTYNDQGGPNDYVIIETNPAFEMQLGITGNSVIGKTGRDVYGVSEPPFLETYVQVAQTGKPVVFETYFQPLAKHYSILIYCPFKGCLATIFRDITESRRAEEVLKESEIKYRELVENSPDAIVIYVGGKIVFVNTECLHLMAAANSTEIIGKSVMQFVHPDYRELVNDRMEKAATADAVLPLIEERFVRLDGSEVEVEVKAMPIRFENKQAVQLIVRDISERKQAEAEIKLKNEQLLKLNAEKDIFFGIIAHDLRSPFSSFLGLSKMMVEQLPDLTADRIQCFIVNIRDSAVNLFRLLENLLEWARQQQGLIPFNQELIQLLPVVNESIAIIQEQAKNKGIEISYDIPDDLEVFADRNILQTILRNLVSNALKFTPKEGKISISAKTTGDKSVEISIKDTGIGMNSEMVNNLFRLDIRTNRIGTEGEPSTGLGLLLCKEFIEKQGGKIWVESEEGRGTTFYFTIP